MHAMAAASGAAAGAAADVMRGGIIATASPQNPAALYSDHDIEAAG